MSVQKPTPQDLSAQIASDIRDAIIAGDLIVDQRLPSEAELADQFSVSRPTVREALKRLAAQNLIRTQRGATGGAFVNRMSFEDAYGKQINTSTLLLSMNSVSFETACEARYALERACAPLSAQRRTPDHLATMRAEIVRQGQSGLSDEAFCASDVAFHRALVDGAGNPVLSTPAGNALGTALGTTLGTALGLERGGVVEFMCVPRAFEGAVLGGYTAISKMQFPRGKAGLQCQQTQHLM